MLRKNIITFWGGSLVVFLVFIGISPALAKVPMIAFLSDRSGSEELYLLFDDNTVEALTKNKTRTIDPDWSPDGKAIIFASNLQGGELFDILTMDVETKKQTNLTQGGFGNNMQKPRWAPKGDLRFLVESSGLPNGDGWDVGVMDLTKKPLAVLNVTNAEGKGRGQDIEAVWSPDGTLVAFQSERDGTFDIFTASMDIKRPGTKQQNITNHAGTDQRPRWSPEGSQILFESNRDGDWEIYTIGIDGKNLRQLTNNDKTDKNAEWSRSGIVFESNRDGDFEIYRMDSDGNNQINLTKDPGSDSNPIWSPNGEKILFESRRDKNRELYVMDTDGSKVQNLTNNPAKDFFGRWNPSFFLLVVEPQQKRLTTFGEIKRTYLLQNYPNPFNPETWMPYILVQDALVTVRIYNLRGELVRSIQIGRQPAGVYLTPEQAAYWDGRNELGQAVASGSYFCQLLADGFSQTRKMVLIK